MRNVTVVRDVTLQELSDCGLNPFAVQLLVESYKRHHRPVPVRFVFDRAHQAPTKLPTKRHHRPVPVRFVFDGITFAIGFAPAELNKLQPPGEQNSAPTLEDA